MLSSTLLLGAIWVILATRASATEDLQAHLGILPHGLQYEVVECNNPILDERSFECGVLEVPVDWHDPTLGSTSLNVYRRQSQSSTERRGTIFIHGGMSYLGKELSVLDMNLLFLNDSWSSYTLYNEDQDLPESIFGNEYDMVYWTPRDRNLTGLTAQCFKSTPERTSFYKRTFRMELSYELEWVEDGTITWPTLQNAEDVRMFLRAQEMMIAHCMKKMGPALFKYVGTASTVRDLVAMADVFERPGALINLWTEAHGSVVASYLMKMFPKRVGRILMDDPVDPATLNEIPSHQRWLKDIATVNNSLAIHEKEMLAGVTHGFGVASGDQAVDHAMFKGTARQMNDKLNGWKNSFDVQFAMDADRECFDAQFDPTKDPSIWFFEFRQQSAGNSWRQGNWGDVDLDGMPLVCGDSLDGQDTDETRVKEDAETLIIDNLGSAPLLTAAAFPPVRYLCHLWPIRAEERISLRPPYDVDTSQNVLILMHKKDYWTYYSASESEARQVWPDVNVISDLPYGDLIWNHDRCSVDIIKNFFHDGTAEGALKKPAEPSWIRSLGPDHFTQCELLGVCSTMPLEGYGRDVALKYGAVSVVLSAAGACTAEESQVPVEQGPQKYNYSVIKCPPDETGFECGVLEVPIDWHDPNLGSTGLNIYRRISHNASERRGTIFMHGGLSYLGRELKLIANLFANDSTGSMYDELPNGVFGDDYDLVYWTPRDRNLTGLTTKCFENAPERTKFYKRTFRQKLVYEPEWIEDGTVTWSDLQGPEDVRMFLRAQEELIKHCLDKMNPALLKHVGTAATVRDLVAMADVFDGPDAPINLWTEAHGSVVASYLMKMFPERVGRIVMDDPVDPITLMETASLHVRVICTTAAFPSVDFDDILASMQRWLDDVAALNNSLAFHETEMFAGTTTGFAVASGHRDLDMGSFKHTVVTMNTEISGWRNSLDMQYSRDADREHFNAWLELMRSGSWSLVFLRHEGPRTLGRFGQDYDLELGGMPLVCGDRLDDPGVDAERMHDEEVEALIVDNLESAPILTSRAFPPLRYLCHLWPIRAQERISVHPPYDVDLGQKVLILMRKKDYWTYYSVSESGARQAWPGANIVSNLPYGDLVWYHDQCSVDIMKEYFRDGVIPDSTDQDPC
ncbi:hypothetical protein C8Q76DRAFT_803480 [Earliella scabrosa]|nr:hypothetical protein C8Q76DRAFT_803480 [Earliella scabrosa]